MDEEFASSYGAGAWELQTLPTGKKSNWLLLGPCFEDRIDEATSRCKARLVAQGLRLLATDGD
jgi:hypothetical protein